ncbi:hypothetical protein SAMN05660297_02702 [Natronincola peptidivorans]|uniref:Uncharacterized protein n=1 Tax=Natronincola peptidivorans TaxID=426128 RepID=A0A1I0F7F7_9FIRM|nr:hypothetical protein [Natronincola peptidivorans]SET53192.1 hypothetical protein SAMN05660297_02702 [Natronincola peptidivorans]
MKCKECNEVEIIKIEQLQHVKFQCKQGHIWFEEYVDQGGSETRPASYKMEIQDILFPSEKQLYKEILYEIDKNEKFFTSSSPKEIMNYLIEKCNHSKTDIYKLFKKINDFDKTKSK